MNTRPPRSAAVPALALVLLLILSSLGLAYAHWTDALHVDGTVYTGEFSAGWTGWQTCSEFHSWPEPPGPGDYGEFGGLDIGATTASIDPADPSLLHVVIENGYPSYAVDCEIEFGNTGTVPWIIRGNTVQPASPNLTNCVLSGTQAKTLACDQLSVVFVDNIGAQVDPGDSVASSLRIHIEQPSLPDSTYQFVVPICVSQWNEALTFGQCMANYP